MNKIWWANKEI